MANSLAIMQPYLFPYLGYFQLVNAVDKFVFYDDVNFIKGGWIDRNFILIAQQPFLFSVPLSRMSSFKKINETKVHPQQFRIWKKKFFKSLQQNYKSAPFFKEVYPIVEETFNSESETIASVAIKSVELISKYLELNTKFALSSNINNNKTKPAAERLIEMCHLQGAGVYYNLYGGRDLYDKQHFSRNNIELHFLKPAEISYQQFTENFHPNLSIIDVLMFNSSTETKNLIKLYSLH